MWNSKPKRHGHDCRNRRHGNPKLGNGPCRWSCSGDQRDAVVERIAGKKVAKDVARCRRGAAPGRR